MSRKTDKLFRRIEQLATGAVECALANPRPRSPE